MGAGAGAGVGNDADSHWRGHEDEPRRQARTRIVRREHNGVHRWRRLPLHASLAFGALSAPIPETRSRGALPRDYPIFFMVMALRVIHVTGKRMGPAAHLGDFQIQLYSSFAKDNTRWHFMHFVILR